MEWFLYAPGFIFGILVGIWLFFIQKYRTRYPKLNLLNLVMWTAGSAFAYYVAVQVYVSSDAVSFSSYSLYNNILFFSLAGLAGASLLGLFTDSILNLKLKQIFLIAILGGILGATFSISNETFLWQFIGWQMGVGICLGVMVDRNQKQVKVL